MHHRRTMAAALAVLAGHAAAQPADWINPAGGSWNTASNWSPAVVPNGPAFDATLGLSDAYAVLCTISPALATLMITNPLATLNLQGGSTLTITGGLLHTDGLVQINSNASIFNAALSFTADTAVTGTGVLSLGASAGNPDILDAQIIAGPGSMVTLGQNLLVSGNGALTGAGSILAEGIIRPSGPATPGIQLRTTLTLAPDAEIDLTDARFDLGPNAVLSGGRVVGTHPLRADSPLTRISNLTLDAPFEVIGGGFVAAIDGPVNNNNTITLNPNVQIFNAILRFDTNATIDGSGQIRMLTSGNAGDAQIVAAPGITGTIGTGQSVSGSGQISGEIVLLGSATADFPATNLSVTGSLTGSGMLRAENAAWLSFTNAAINGLTIETATDGVVGAAVGTSSVSDLTNNGHLVVAGGSTVLTLNDDITNNGIITLNFDNRIFNAILRFDTNADIGGSGQIRMLTSGDAGDAQITTATGVTGTIGGGQAVSGSGQIAGDILLLGSITADEPSVNLELRGNVSGPGLLRAENNGWLSFINASLSDLTIETETEGVVGAAVGTTVASGLTNSGHFVIAGGSTVLSLTGDTTNNGTITVNFDNRIFNAILRLDDPAGITGDGEIILQTAGDLNDAQITVPDLQTSQLGAGQTLAGTGELRGNLSVLGSIRPSGDSRRINVVNGTLTMGPGTTSTFQIGGTQADQFGRLTANNAASIHLDGACVVRFDDDYAPLRGDSWDILSALNRTGEFTSFDLPPAPFGLAYRVFYQPGRVFVRLTCSSDFDGDNVLNFFDVSTYLALFNAQDPRADLSAPFGQFNFFDIAAFINNFNAGCP